MSRSPWRAALDGKIQALRACRAPNAHLSLVSYFTESPTLKAMRDPRTIRTLSEQHARVMLAALEEETREAEPFYISHDVGAAIGRAINEIKRDDHPFKGYRFSLDDLPARSGLIWFSDPIHIERADGSGELLAVIRGLFFDRAYKDPVAGKILLDERRTGNNIESLGIVAWIDADRSPFFPSAYSGGMIPWVHPYLSEGQSLREYVEEVAQTYGDSDMDVAMHTMPAHFLAVLFGLLKQRVLRFGGSGLERDARRQAERDGLKPIVQVITWRKADVRYPEGHIPKLIDWSCHWDSRPHIRRLRNPDGSIRKVIEVKGCTKGDRTKPYKEPNIRVHDVRR